MTSSVVPRPAAGECVNHLRGEGVIRCVLTGPPLGADVAVAAIATIIHSSHGAYGILRIHRGMRRPIFVEKIHVVGVRIIELLVDFLDRAVENYGGRRVARDCLDGPGQIDNTVLWVGGCQIGGRDLVNKTCQLKCFGQSVACQCSIKTHV